MYPIISQRRILTRFAPLMLPLLLGACASLSPDGGFDDVEKIAQTRLGQKTDGPLIWQRTPAESDAAAQKVKKLLVAPLNADSAVEVALLNNRGLQAALFELGISEADMVQSSQMANPGFSFGRLTKGDEVELERGIHFSLVRLLALPYTRQMEQRRFEASKRQAALQMLSMASETRKAFYTAVAADQTLQYMQQVKKAADASAELARRMLKAGNFNQLQQVREQSFYSDAVVSLAHAAQSQNRAREKLTRLLGVSVSGNDATDTGGFILPARLPDLPANLDPSRQIEQLAIDQRLDVQAARLGTEQLAHNLGLSKATRFINVLELGAVNNTSNQAPTQRGYEISLELPLFNWGGARIAKAEAVYMQALNRTAEIAINAQSEVRQAYFAYSSSYDIARHYRDEIVPLKKKISEENLLRYNGMFIGVFDLLADARSQIASVNSAIEATRDFWLAQADLDMSLTGKPDFSISATSNGSATTGSANGVH